MSVEYSPSPLLYHTHITLNKPIRSHGEVSLANNRGLADQGQIR